MSKYVERRYEEVKDAINDLLEAAIVDFIDSAEFIEAAETYCRENGWKEPENEV